MFTTGSCKQCLLGGLWNWVSLWLNSTLGWCGGAAMAALSWIVMGLTASLDPEEGAGALAVGDLVVDGVSSFYNFSVLLYNDMESVKNGWTVRNTKD